MALISTLAPEASASAAGHHDRSVDAGAAAGRWSSPVRIASWGNDPLACSNGEVLFGDGVSERFSRVRWAAGRFSRAQRLARLPGGTRDPSVACDGRGHVLVAAVQRRRVVVARSARTGAWMKLHAVSAASREAGVPDLAVAPSGAAVVAYAVRTRRGWHVEASTRARRGATFGPAQVLTPANRDYPWVNATVGARGDGLVTWHWEREDGSFVTGREGPLWAAIGRPDGHWAPAQALGDGGESADVALAVSPSGRMLVAWVPWYFGTREDEEPSRLLIAERASGGEFAAARQLAGSTPGDIEDGGPVATIAGDGRALVAWVRPTGPVSFGTGASVLEAFTRPRDGDFTGQALTSADATPEFPILTTAGNGALALGWIQRWPSGGGARLGFSVGALGAALGPAQPVSPRRDQPTWPTAVLTADGDLIAVWLKGGAGSGSVMAAVRRDRR